MIPRETRDFTRFIAKYKDPEIIILLLSLHLYVLKPKPECRYVILGEMSRSSRSFRERRRSAGVKDTSKQKEARSIPVISARLATTILEIGPRVPRRASGYPRTCVSISRNRVHAVFPYS